MQVAKQMTFGLSYSFLFLQHIIFRFLCMIAMIALVFWFLDLNNHVSIYEYKHVYNIFANMYILLVLENT